MLWELTRSTALVATVALSLSTALGAAAAGRTGSRLLSQALHRNLAALAAALTAAHVVTVLADGYVPLGWRDAVVPFAGGYKRVGTGLGTVALDLLVVVALSALLRGRLGPRGWRALHVSAYALCPLAVGHGLLTGTDDVAVQALSAGCAVLVVGGLTSRLVTAPRAAVR